MPAGFPCATDWRAVVLRMPDAEESLSHENRSTPESGVAGSSLVPLTPDGVDESPTVITSPRANTDSEALVGRMLGGFEVVGAVGVGGMATVLKAVDRELGREVALKILPAAMASDPDAVARFKAEARAAARLDHDNVARVFACGEDSGRQFIAFEYVAGENLRDLIQARGPLPAGECVGYMLQVAAGLDHAAARGVVHRDIKPSNIVVTPTGRAKIVDMGLARNLDQPANGGVTQSGVTLGTFDYISPEQALDPRRADVRSDIYSLGCTFYHALTGRSPVPEGTAARKLSAHQNDPILDPRVLNPAVPDAVAVVLARMMAKDPAKRYQTPAALAADLRPLAPAGEARPLLTTVRPTGGPLAVLTGLGVLGVAVGVAAILAGGPRGADVRPPVPEPTPGLPPILPPPIVSPVTPPPLVTSLTVEDTPRLMRALADPAVTEIQLLPDTTYDLTALGPVVAAGTRLTLTAKGGGTTPPVVLLTLGGSGPLRGGLVVPRTEEVVLRGLHFRIAGLGELTEGSRSAGVTIANAARVEVADCRFESGGDLAASEPAALSVTRSGPMASTLSVRNCVFGARRGPGLGLVGRVRAEVREVGFAPHPAAITLDPALTDPQALPEITLRSCTFLLTRGGAAVEAAGPARIAQGLCVFATPEPDLGEALLADPTERTPAAIRSLQEAPDAATVTAARPGEPSLYYHVTPVVTPAGPVLPGLEAGIQSLVSPWASANPVRVLDSARPWEAFRLNTAVPAVRTAPPARLLGAVELPRAGAKMYDPWPPPADPTGRVRIVRPELPTDGVLPPLHYRTLEAAVAEAQTGDVIELRHSGPLVLPPLTIERPRVAVTIRPPLGTRLVVSPEETFRADGSLIRLVEGAVTLENLDIRLQPRTEPLRESRPVAAVAVVAGTGVSLKNCSVTMEGTEPQRLAAVTLADAEGEMRAGTVTPPTVVFTDSLIRGSGSAVGARVARPFSVEATNTVFALAGPIVDVAAPVRLVRLGTTWKLKLDRVTAWLGGPVVRLEAGPPDTGFGVVAGSLSASRTLFAFTEREPLISVRDAPAGPLESLLSWRSDGSNVFANAASRATWVVSVPAEGMATMLDLAGFLRYSQESRERSIGAVPFPGAPTSVRRLASVTALDLTPDSDTDVPNIPTAGADLKLIAQPRR